MFSIKNTNFATENRRCGGYKISIFEMAQDIIVMVLFAAALCYVGYLVYKNFQARSGCSSGCGSCGLNIDKIAKELQKKKVV